MKELEDKCPSDPLRIRELTTIGQWHPDKYDEIRQYLSSRPNGYEAYCAAKAISEQSTKDHAAYPADVPQMMFVSRHYRGSQEILFELKVPRISPGFFDAELLSNIYKENWDPSTGKRKSDLR